MNPYFQVLLGALAGLCVALLMILTELTIRSGVTSLALLVRVLNNCPQVSYECLGRTGNTQCATATTSRLFTKGRTNLRGTPPITLESMISSVPTGPQGPKGPKGPKGQPATRVAQRPFFLCPWGESHLFPRDR